MAHEAQRKFCESVKALYPQYFFEKHVLDVGSLDVNGTNRYLFTDCKHVGIDLIEGPNVDHVSLAHEWMQPFKAVYDTIISTECFEHDKYLPWTLQSICKLLKPGGLFLFTCATTGRPEHGTAESKPDDSPATHDYYKNVRLEDIMNVVDVEKYFTDFSFQVNGDDLYFYGIKR
jgi:SAM-dependent methyltransferase